jgi:hypothetical protein
VNIGIIAQDHSDVAVIKEITLRLLKTPMPWASRNLSEMAAGRYNGNAGHGP